jgi:NAD-dependent deacetylase
MDELTPFAVHNATGVRVPASLILALRGARHVAVLTGAGVSAESGIPTFRDALTGLWERFDAEQLATPAAFRRDPDLVWGWYEWRRMKVLRAQPNPAHIAIAVMQCRVPRLTLITQNVDDLHERSGSTDVIHLHGSLHALRCFTCARPHRLVEGVPEEPEGGRRLPPLRCAHCGEAIRPGVVWFGEPASARRVGSRGARGRELRSPVLRRHIFSGLSGGRIAPPGCAARGDYRSGESQPDRARQHRELFAARPCRGGSTNANRSNVERSEDL